MAKIRLTKNELKKQKDDLKRFTRYLPTLELKKQQLLVEIRKIQNDIAALTTESEKVDTDVSRWVDLFSEDVDLDALIDIREINLGMGNIAGIDIPLFNELHFNEVEYDFFNTPLWIDRALQVSKKQLERQVKIEILRMQDEIISNELRITIQRIKLFEEVKIPNSKENIRMIRIFLGDLQTAEVVRGKIAKTKIMKKKEMVDAE